MFRTHALTAVIAVAIPAAAMAAPSTNGNEGVRAISTMAMCDSPALNAPGFPGWAHIIPCFGNR